MIARPHHFAAAVCLALLALAAPLEAQQGRPLPLALQRELAAKKGRLAELALALEAAEVTIPGSAGKAPRNLVIPPTANMDRHAEAALALTGNLSKEDLDGFLQGFPWQGVVDAGMSGLPLPVGFDLETGKATVSLQGAALSEVDDAFGTPLGFLSTVKGVLGEGWLEFAKKFDNSAFMQYLDGELAHKHGRASSGAEGRNKRVASDVKEKRQALLDEYNSDPGVARKREIVLELSHLREEVAQDLEPRSPEQGGFRKDIPKAVWKFAQNNHDLLEKLTGEEVPPLGTKRHPNNELLRDYLERHGALIKTKLAVYSQVAPDLIQFTGKLDGHHIIPPNLKDGWPLTQHDVKGLREAILRQGQDLRLQLDELRVSGYQVGSSRRSSAGGLGSFGLGSGSNRRR